MRLKKLVNHLFATQQIEILEWSDKDGDFIGEVLYYGPVCKLTFAQPFADNVYKDIKNRPIEIISTDLNATHRDGEELIEHEPEPGLLLIGIGPDRISDLPGFDD